MTRARENLTMTTARQRMLYGRTTNNMPSRFLEEIPGETMDWQSRVDNRITRSEWDEPAGFGGSSSFGGSSFGDFGSSRQTTTESRTDFSYGSVRSSRHSATMAAGFTGSSSAKPALQLNKGDMIRHRTFGQGMVISVRPMGGDALIEVAFDQVGTKKLMLKAAGVHITKL